MALNRLSEVRNRLNSTQSDLQRAYKFRISSTKLIPIEAYIISVNQPYYQYSNSGDYKGSIDKVIKPSEITIVFLEDQELSVNKFFDAWDGLKWNKNTGIIYPKLAYTDNLVLEYIANRKKPSEFAGSNVVDAVVNSEDITDISRNLNERITDRLENNRYNLKGAYPINRDSYTLGYEQNDVIRVSVTFNVDEVDVDFLSLLPF